MSPEMKYLLKKEIAYVLLCLLVGFALRFYTFDQKSLWMDEIYTFNDSRYGIKEQLAFYKHNPTYLHPPLFFILTNLFYPFEKPERDLRIIPLISGTLSILMFYLLANQFSASIALPCAISLTFTAYHICLSQDARSYSLLLFLGMAGLYFLMKHLKTSKKRYLVLVALFFAVQFHTSYSSIPFITISQILWLYRPNEEYKRPSIDSFLFLNGLIFFLCLPWMLFVLLNYRGQPLMDPFHTEDPGHLWSIFYGILHDWVPHIPLLMLSIILLIVFPLFSEYRKNALVLIAVFILPIIGLNLFCKLFNITHFITSRYFINFLPLFLITLYLSLYSIEVKFKRLENFMRLRILFTIILVISNIAILPPYYFSEKQDLRGLVTYLKGQLQEGDKIFLETPGYIPGILHYFGEFPRYRQQRVPFWKSEGNIGLEKSFIHRNRTVTLLYSKTCCSQYVADGSRVWIVVGKWTAKKIKEESPAVLKGYFDGSFLNLTRFPVDASMYLFLWDPKSPDEKGIDMPIE